MDRLRFSGLLLLVTLVGCGGGGASSSLSNGGGSGGGGALVEYGGDVTAQSEVLDDGAPFATLGVVGFQTGTAHVSASSTAFDTLLVVEQLNTDGTSDVVAANDDSEGGTGSSVSFGVEPGVHYSIMVTSAAGTVTGPFSLQYEGGSLSADGRAIGLHRIGKVK